MQLKNLFAGVVVATTTLGLATSAFSQTVRQWQGGASGTWNTPGNWSGSNVPDTVGEIARFVGTGAVMVELDGSFTIGGIEAYTNRGTHSNVTLVSDDIDGTPTRRTLTLDGDDAGPSTTFGKVVVFASNQLIIDQQVTLKFFDPDAASEIGGTLALTHATTVVEVDISMTFGPGDPGGTPDYGLVDGVADASLISIGSSQTLTNQIRMLGGMDIDAASGTATLVNFYNGVADSGIVRSDRASLTLALGANLIVDDNDGALWQVIASSSVLQFNRNATGLEGDFYIENCALLDVIGIQVVTTGTFTHCDYQVDASSSGLFDWLGSGGFTRIMNGTAMVCDECP